MWRERTHDQAGGTPQIRRAQLGQHRIKTALERNQPITIELAQAPLEACVHTALLMALRPQSVNVFEKTGGGIHWQSPSAHIATR
jgi:hypothetical protein